MRPAAAWLLVAGLAAGTTAALAAPWEAAGALALATALGLRRGRAGFLAFAAATLALGALALGLAHPGADLADRGLLRLSRAGALAGLVGALRLAALMGLNLAVLSWVPAVRVLDGLRLPPRATAIVAAVLIAAQDVGGDLRRLALAARLEGARPGRREALRRAALWFPALLVASLGRAATRRDALRLAGHPMPPGFVPVVAFAALAAASRLALAPLPHLKLTYLVVFLGGLVAGPRAGALAAAVAMVVSDVVLSGLLPEAFVNVPAMAALGALGGLLRRTDFSGRGAAGRAAGALLAGAVGVAATLLFSVLADAGTWLVVPEYRAQGLAGLRALAAMGLAFNAVPAAFNGLLFAAAVGPTQATLRRLGTVGTAAALPPDPGPPAGLPTVAPGPPGPAPPK